MTSCTPAISSSVPCSTSPLFPVMPIAVRCAPGMAWARYPSFSIFSQTLRTCSSVACAFMTTNMDSSYLSCTDGARFHLCSCGDSRPFDKLRAGSRLSGRAKLDSLPSPPPHSRPIKSTFATLAPQTQHCWVPKRTGARNALYFPHAPLSRPRTRHSRPSRAETPAPPHFPPHWHSHVHRRRNSQRRRARLPHRVQYFSDFLFWPAPVGSL